MGKFILGIVFAVVLLLLIAIGCALLGFLPMRANSSPSKLEGQVAMGALDSSIERHAPRLANPVPVTDDNLIDALKIYTMNCALCHGGLDRQPSQLAQSLYPPPPNLISDPDDDPEWHIFYVIKNGVRYSGMPAWDKSLSSDDMWKLTAFLSRIEKLPPGVQEYWKKSTAGAPVVSAPIPEKGDHHDHH
ncbi:MAG: c-type cytochrome [Terriglobales bacterium]